MYTRDEVRDTGRDGWARLSSGQVSRFLEREADVAKPRLRGVLHEWGFYATVPLGVWLATAADGARGRAGAVVFAIAVVGMFGCSALYHRFSWSPSVGVRLRRLDHAGIFGLIAGTYTPFALVVVGGVWRVAVLAAVWAGALVGVTAKVAWARAPRWLTAAVGLILGWVGLVVFPQVLDRGGAAVASLVLAGGILYTLGALVYALRRPDPAPAVFGFHELFHALVVLAVALQYAAVVIVLA
jgi:hemolysin III